MAGDYPGAFMAAGTYPDAVLPGITGRQILLVGFVAVDAISLDSMAA